MGSEKIDRTTGVSRRRPSSAPPAWARPEAELLLCACSVLEARERDDRFRSIVQGATIDWGHLMHLALANRTVPLVWEHVSRLGENGPPPKTLERYQGAARRSKLSAMAMTHELGQVCDLLESRGVSPVPLKGPVLAHQLYGDTTRRQYLDLDILVPRGSVRTAVELIESRGYEPRYPVSAEEEQKLLDEDCQYVFDHPGTNIKLELHWDGLPRRHARGFDLWSTPGGLVPYSMWGSTFRTFPPGSLILYLCIHGGDKHLWNRIQCLSDVAQLLATHDLDWDVVLEQASAVGRVRTVLLGAYLSWLHLDAPLPAPIIERILADPSVIARGGLLGGRCFRRPSRIPAFHEWRHDLQAAAATIHGWGHKFRLRAGFSRYLRTVLKPEWTDRESLALPAGLSFLYYIYRPLRLIRQRTAELQDR